MAPTNREKANFRPLREAFMALLLALPEAIAQDAGVVSSFGIRADHGTAAAPSTIHFSLAQKPFENVLNVSRGQTAFSAYGSVARLATGVRDGLEIRAEGGWITAASSGHSGQFDAAVGAKRHFFSSGNLNASALATVGGEKSMGYLPWYSASLKLPVSAAAAAVQVSVAPLITHGLHREGSPALGMETAAVWDVFSRLSLFGETFYYARRPNPRFSSFFSPSDGGMGFLAGVLLRPRTDFRIPVTLVFKSSDGQMAYGLAGFGVQGVIAL